MVGEGVVNLDTIKQREKAYHERIRTGDREFPPLDPAQHRRDWLDPTWATGVDRYNDARREFHAHVAARGGWSGRQVLDYGCGNGTWALYLRLTGAARVVGFDLAESGVRRGMQRVRAQGEADTVQLVCGDATRLPLADASIEMAVGHGVLHHVIKYPDIFPELHRVLRPGGRAFFLENLADNPLFRLWWWWKGEVEEGDVPIFEREVRRLARDFARVEVTGTDFFHSAATFLFRPQPAAWRRAALRATHAADRRLFKLLPAARRWGSFSFIELEKRA